MGSYYLKVNGAQIEIVNFGYVNTINSIEFNMTAYSNADTKIKTSNTLYNFEVGVLNYTGDGYHNFIAEIQY